MDKMSILMNRDAFESWGKAHPLGSYVKVTVNEIELSGTVCEFAEYHGRIEVRIRLNKGA